MDNKSVALAVCIALAGPKIAAAEIFTGIAAMNLGDINSGSFLDEYFSGSIPILYTSAKEALAFKARLAPTAVFDDLGVEKIPILKSLQFSVKIRNNKPYVAIKSTKAIDLPFLSFVVEVYSPEGSIYQDYTVLLDPRHLSIKNMFTNVKASNETKPRSGVDTVVVTPLNTVKISRPKKLRVKAGDTLSSIASTVKLDKISNKNMSLAIFLTNPQAFSGNNANKLKKGVTLKIPTSDDVKELILRKPQTAKHIKQTKKVMIQEPSLSNKTDVKVTATVRNQDSETINYKVKGGDTLSAIARTYASKATSTSTLMTLIHSANPHAFANNQVNLLKKGATLKIPLGNSFKLEAKEKGSLTTNSDQLETTINQSLNSLEKRLREIRKTLKATKAELFDLKLTLQNKDILLERQSKDIRILKEKLQNSHQARLINDEKAALTEANQRKVVENISSVNKMSTSEAVTYSGLAFLIGLVLLRVGRQKYAEKIVSSDDYVSTVNVDTKLGLQELDFTKTLTEAAKASDNKITDLSIQEAERLVEELVEELDHPENTLQDDQSIISSGIIDEKVDSSLDSWVMESEKPHVENETIDLKADIINNLEKTIEERIQPEGFVVNEPFKQKQAKHEALEIDLERHLQSINDQIVANKMKI